jgi:hypothetical protein
MKKKYVIYIAGPFRSKKPGDHWEQTQNIRRAEALALEVWKAGHVALCPHLNTANFQGALPDDVWLDGDLELLRRCDAVLLVAGYQESAGTHREIREAVDAGIPVYEGYALKLLLAYLEAPYEFRAPDYTPLDTTFPRTHCSNIAPANPRAGDTWIQLDEGDRTLRWWKFDGGLWRIQK